MRSSFFRSAVSTVLILTSTFSWSTPAWALRPAERGESKAGAEEVRVALVSDGATAPTPAVQPFPGALARMPAKAATGAEEWKEITRTELPGDLWRDLLAYGTWLEKVEYIAIRPPDSGGPASQPFAHPGAEAGISMSVNQALGSYLFKGLGAGLPKEQKDQVKVLADGNAVFMGFHSLVDYTLRHPKEAFLVLGDEGDRDSSIALRTGSIFLNGQIVRFKDMATLRVTLAKLLAQGVRIWGVIGDALEVTNDFVEGRPNSWGVATIVDLPQSEEGLKTLALIPDMLRRAGWVYHAPRPALDLSPFDLPEDGFKKIARANGVDPNDQKVFEPWMAQRRQTTLHGKRSFLAPARDQGEALMKKHKGFSTYFPNDGDLFPAVLAAMGLEVDGHYGATVTRHGSNEGFIAAVAANNVRDAHFVHTYASVKNTEKAASLTARTSHNFVPDERATAAGFGIMSTNGEMDPLTAVDTKESWPHRGVVVMSSVTGASQELAGQWSSLLKELEFRGNPDGLGGLIAVHTFVLAQDGSAYVIRTTLRSDDLPETKEWVKLASRLPSSIPPPIEKPAPETQILSDLSSVVAQDNLPAVLSDPKREVSQTFRYVLPDQLAQALQKLGIGYHLTFLHPGQIGTGASAEFHRTRGHFHSKPLGELVEVYDGRGKILLWRTSSPHDPAMAADAILLSVKGGDKFFVPPGWAHLTLNEDPNQMLVFGTWLRQDVKLQYDAVNSLRGGPWYVGPEGSEPNPNYAHVPPYQSKVPNPDYLEKSLGIPPDRSIWSVALTDPARFNSIMEHVTKESDPALVAEQLFGAAAAGAEESPAPIIGFLPKLAGKEAELSAKLLAGDPSAKGQATKLLNGAVNKSPPEFQQAFGKLLLLSRGDMEVFAQTFERSVAKQAASVHDAVLGQVRLIAQDPGAPNNIPPVSYFNPARYVYARLQQKLFDGFVRDVLSKVVETAQGVSASVDLSDVRQKKAALGQKLQEGRQTVGPYQYEVFWDSLVHKGGETYLTLELLLDGEQGYEKGVVLELQVVIPAAGSKPQYVGPYPLALLTQTLPNFSVGLLDPIHFINNRFSEWRPKAQRDIYESRLQALKDSNEKDKRQFIRPSERQGNNPRFFEPFFRAFLAGNVPLAYHIVDALASERDYGNQGGVGSVGNLASAIVRRGGIGATASWLLEEPDAARIVAGEGRTLVYSYEKDHHRIDNIKDVVGFASELEPFLLAYPENLVTGWPSANLQDETKFINQQARGEMLKAGEAIAQTGVVDETTFGLLQGTYNGNPVAEGLPNSLTMHWLRNRWLHHVVDSLAAEGVPVTPFNRWYIEPDYALDAKPHTVEEMAYLTFVSWVSAQTHGHPLGAVVPSYGNVHGASAGNPSLALAGILQYAAQAATLYGDPLPPEFLAIAQKAPRGSLDVAKGAASHFKDASLREEFLQTVTSANERTADEETRLSGFILAQIRKIPADVLKTLKEAEQVLLKEVAAAQVEKRQPKTLEEAAPEVNARLNTLTARLDKEISALPLERRAGITTHAASGLSAAQLSKAREYGVIWANKSTEFQNIITKQLEAVYLMSVNPAKAQEVLAQMPAARAAWDAHPMTQQEIQQVAGLYARMYDAAAARAIKAAKTDSEKDALRQAASNLLRPFPWFWRDNTGWSMEDPAGKDWSAYEWVPGAHGRYMFSMRDTMTGQGTDNTLLFPNALTWGLPSTVIQMAQAEIERTIHFYHQPSVMNAVGGAAEFHAKAGVEEQVVQAIAQLDSLKMEERLEALRTLRRLEREGTQIPVVGPVLPSYIHVHTTASYPGLPGVFSPAHMVWAAHQAGVDQIWLVDHETVAHIGEGFQAVQIINEGRETPLKAIFGIEFKAPVARHRTALRTALREGVAAGDAAWVVAWGVPVGPNGEVPEALGKLVQQFQEAKRARAKEAVRQIRTKTGIRLSLEDLLALSPDGNITDRLLDYVAAQTGLASVGSIRKNVLNAIPLESEYGFPLYENVVTLLSGLGMVPTFTMQVSAPALKELVGELKEIGIRAFDVAGIESHHANAAADIAAVIHLAEQNQMPIVGGVDYRGEGAIGWPQAADWMRDPAVTRSISELSSRPAQYAAGTEEWKGAPNVTLTPAPHADDSAVLRGFNALGDQMWVSLPEFYGSGPVRLGFRAVNSGKVVSENVTVLRMVPLKTMLDKVLPATSVQEIWVPGQGQDIGYPDFRNPKTLKLLRSEPVLLALAEGKRELIQTMTAEGKLGQSAANPEAGLLQLGFRLEESALFFNTAGEDQSTWTPFAHLTLAKKRTGGRVQILFSALRQVRIDRKSNYQKQQNGTNPAAGVEEQVKTLKDTVGLVTITTTPRNSAGKVARKQADIAEIVTRIEVSGGQWSEYSHPGTDWTEAVERHQAVARVALAAKAIVAAEPNRFLTNLEPLFVGPLTELYAGAEEAATPANVQRVLDVLRPRIRDAKKSKEKPARDWAHEAEQVYGLLESNLPLLKTATGDSPRDRDIKDAASAFLRRAQALLQNRTSAAGAEETPHAVFAALQELGVHYSYDFLTPVVLADGTIQKMVDRKVISAATTNPTSNWSVWQQAVMAPDGAWREAARELIRQGRMAQEIYDTLFVGRLVRPAAAIFLPVNQSSNGRYGYVSYEFRPTWAQPVEEANHGAFMTEADNAFNEIMRLDALLRKELGAHNVFVKVHGTNTGVWAARNAHRNGANINYTLLSRKEHVRAAMEAHKTGNYGYAGAGGRYDQGPAGEAVFSMFVSRTDREIDPLLSDLKLLKVHVDRRLSLPNGTFGGPANDTIRERLQASNKLYEHLLQPGNEPARDTFLNDIAHLKMRAGLAYAKAEIYPLIKEQYLDDSRWQEFMRETGARMPQIYWGSTGVKVGSAYTTDPHYFGQLKGAYTTNTSPPEVITMLAGTPAEQMPFDASLTVEQNLDKDREVLTHLAGLGIDIELVQQDVQDKGLKSFAADDAKTFAAIEQSIQQISQEETQRIQNIAQRVEYSRWKDLQIITLAKSGHPGGTLSIAEIMETLYDPGVMRINPDDRAVPITERWLNRDRLVLSKGHAVPMQYVALANAGILTNQEIEALRQDPTNFAQGHATLSITPGIDFSTGALGYGAPAAAGMAVAAKMDGRDFHTFTIIGDGEMEKGPIYEMAQAASVLGLDNLTAIIDYNQYQQNYNREKYTPMDFDRLAEFWRLNNWNVVAIDGEHLADNVRYITELRQALTNSKTQKNGKPTVILVKTIKGRGVSLTEDRFRAGSTEFHGKALTPEQYEAATREIAPRLGITVEGRKLADIEADMEKVGEEVRAELRARQLNPTQIGEIDQANAVSSEQARQARLAKQVVPLPQYQPGGKLVATREASGAAWTHYASLTEPIALANGKFLDPTKIVLVSPSDLQDSENFVQFGKQHGVFSPKNPFSRLIEMGIMEDAGFKLAEGIAATGLGYLPVVGTFDRFVSYVQETLNHAAQDNLAMVINASHGGSETGADGTSQYSVQTPAGIYSLTDQANRVEMFEASDAPGTLDAAELALTSGKVSYLRTGRNPRPVLDRAQAVRRAEKNGFIVWKEPAEPDITLVASGATVANTLEAARTLEQQGIRAAVVEVTSVTRVDDKWDEKNPFPWGPPAAPIYTVHDASVASMRLPLLVAEKSFAFSVSHPVYHRRILSRGITVTGSGSTDTMFQRNRFTAPQIAEDAAAIVTAFRQKKPELLPQGVETAGAEEEPQELVEARAAVSTAQIQAAAALREGDLTGAESAQIALVNAGNQLARAQASSQAAGAEETLEGNRLLVSFDLPAGVALAKAGMKPYVVVPTSTDARHELKLGVPPEQLIGLLWAGLEEGDYLAVNPGIRSFAQADPMATGWQQSVLRVVSQQIAPDSRVIPIYDSQSLATGLEELGVPGASVSGILQARSRAVQDLGQMD